VALSNQGPGKVRLKDLQTIPQSNPNEMLVKVRVDLYNFDIDIATPLKDEHKKFLDEKIIPALAANKDARYVLIGSASRSGEHDHNKVLSGGRADEVQKYLASHNVGSQLNQFPLALGDPKDGPMEDEHDRAVFIFLSLPIKLDDLSLWTDDWSRGYRLDDMIGLPGTDKRSIDKINLHVEVVGAPRIWDLGNLSVAIMPTSFPLQAKANRDGKVLIRNYWNVPVADARFQPNDPQRTVYHLSGSVSEMGFSINREPGYAGVIRRDVYFTLSPAGWVSRGTLAEGSRGADVRSDALRLLQAGGYELIGLSLTKGDSQKVEEFNWVLRSPAEVFYYSGAPVSPAFLLENWKKQSDMKVLIIGQTSVLAMNVQNGVASGGSGAGFANLLKGRGGPFTAILGYRDGGPSTGDQQDIAKMMGEAIARGLADDKWSEAWLGLNTPGAVAMDGQGYWWIEERSTWSRSKDFPIPFKSGPKYKIVGPAVIR
jgi:hypothetical protein